MLVYAGRKDEKSKEVYRYTFSTSNIKARQLRHLAFSHVQCSYSDSGADAAFIVAMSFMIPFLPLTIVLTYTYPSISSIFGAACLTLMNLSGFIPMYLRIKRNIQLRKLSARGMLSRSHTIIIENGCATESYAYHAIMKTGFGQKVLRPALMHSWVTDSWKLKKYLRYVATNPDNELFPKLKPEFDAFLTITAGHDEAIAKFNEVASEGEIKRLKAEVDQFAVETVARMQIITDEHNTPIETRRQMVIDEKRRIADTELQQIPSLSVYQELPQPL